MQVIDTSALKSMTKRYRAQFINSLSGFKSANLIGTVDEKGHPNLAIFSSVVHLGADPALIGFISRPDSVERHTLSNIKTTGRYTINQINDAFWQQAHQTSARFAARESEFEKCGLTPHFESEILAPFVAESRLKMALSLREIMPIRLNNTLMVVGEITHVFCESDAIQADGYIDIEALNTVAISGLDSYHQTKRNSRLSYAKPDMRVQELTLEGVASESN